MKSKILLVAVCISLGLVFIVPQGVLADCGGWAVDGAAEDGARRHTGRGIA